MPGDQLNYDAHGWPYLDGQNNARLIDDYTRALSQKLQASDAQAAADSAAQAKSSADAAKSSADNAAAAAGITGLQSGANAYTLPTGRYWASAPVAGSISGSPGPNVAFLLEVFAPTDGTEKWQRYTQQAASGLPPRVYVRTFAGNAWSALREVDPPRQEVAITYAAGITPLTSSGWNGLHLFIRGGVAFLFGAVSGASVQNPITQALPLAYRPPFKVGGRNAELGTDGVPVSTSSSGVIDVALSWPIPNQT